MIENHHIQGLRGFNEKWLSISSREVLARIRKGDDAWNEMVPPQVAGLIKERRLFGFQG
jgi:hypothetical protein